MRCHVDTISPWPTGGAPSGPPLRSSPGAPWARPLAILISAQKVRPGYLRGPLRRVALAGTHAAVVPTRPRGRRGSRRAVGSPAFESLQSHSKTTGRFPGLRAPDRFSASGVPHEGGFHRPPARTIGALTEFCTASTCAVTPCKPGTGESASQSLSWPRLLSLAMPQGPCYVTIYSRRRALSPGTFGLRSLWSR